MSENYSFYPGFKVNFDGRLLALKKDINGKPKLKLLDIAEPLIENSVCESIDFQQISLSSFSGDSVFMASRLNHVVNFYKINLINLECQLLNSIPLSTASSDFKFGELKFNLKKRTLAFKQSAVVTGLESKDDLYMVPMNGSPPFLVSFPALSNAKIEDFQFSENGDYLYFWGNQSEALLRHIYKVPAK